MDSMQSVWDDREFQFCLREINRLVRAENYYTVLATGVAGVLKLAIRNTPEATPKQILRRARRRAAGKAGMQMTRAPEWGMRTINLGVNGPYGRVWLRTPRDKWNLVLGPGFARNAHHVKAGDWIDVKETVEDYRSALKRQLDHGTRARGLARQSWLQCIDAMGVDVDKVPPLYVKVPARVRSAMGGGMRRQNGTAIRGQSGRDELTITVINSYPRQADMEFGRILASARDQRTKAMTMELHKGVFDDVKTLERRYPILVSAA
jgi:hypothetical protein